MPSYDSYNLEGIRNDAFPQDEETSEALTYVSHINKLRKGVRYKEYTESGYIFVTETSKVLDVSKNMIALLSAEDEKDAIHACGFAQNMSGISNITANIDTLKADLKEKKTALKAAQKELTKLEAKEAAVDQKAAEAAKKSEAEAVLKKLLANGVSADEILAKLK